MKPEETKARIENNKTFLNWIYERMICVHEERDVYDYMINFKSIIDNLGVEIPEEGNTGVEKDDKLTMALIRISDDGIKIAELRQSLSELIPIAERLIDICEYKVDANFNYYKDKNQYKSAIERAKKLI